MCAKHYGCCVAKFLAQMCSHIRLKSNNSQHSRAHPNMRCRYTRLGTVFSFSVLLLRAKLDIKTEIKIIVLRQVSGCLLWYSTNTKTNSCRLTCPRKNYSNVGIIFCWIYKLFIRLLGVKKRTVWFPIRHGMNFMSSNFTKYNNNVLHGGKQVFPVWNMLCSPKQMIILFNYLAGKCDIQHKNVFYSCYRTKMVVKIAHFQPRKSHTMTKPTHACWQYQKKRIEKRPNLFSHHHHHHPLKQCTVQVFA